MVNGLVRAGPGRVRNVTTSFKIFDRILKEPNEFHYSTQVVGTSMMFLVRQDGLIAQCIYFIDDLYNFPNEWSGRHFLHDIFEFIYV